LRRAAIFERKVGVEMSRKLPSAPVGEIAEFDLDVLIARITTENRHEEFCIGSCSKGDAA
jgi:hypothetical protein